MLNKKQSQIRNNTANLKTELLEAILNHCDKNPETTMIEISCVLAEMTKIYITHELEELWINNDKKQSK